MQVVKYTKKYLLTTAPTGEAAETTEYAKAKFRLNTVFNPDRNPHVERFEFRKKSQRPDETVDQYYTRLKIASKYCDFANEDEEITGHIIQSCTSERLRRQLLSVNKLKIADALSYGRTHDILEGQLKTLETTQPQVNAMFHRPQQAGALAQAPTQCRGCGSHPHPRAECPAQGKTCRLCGKLHHYASVCESAGKTASFGNADRRSTRSKGRSQQRRSNQGRSFRGNHATHAQRDAQSSNQATPGLRVNHLTVDTEDLFGNWNPAFQIGSTSKLPFTDVKICDQTVRMMVDTGCSINIIDEARFAKMHPRPDLKPNLTPVHTYNSNNRLNILGEFDASIETQNTSTITTIVVVAGNGGCLLGYETAVKLDVVRLTCTVTANPHCY